ncbi:MAG: class I SAM-dependent methyltransferase [Fusicatenibacter sp.]|nr:class I SAM-dependent methyltransferase [Fusicatenibacter sp.]
MREYIGKVLLNLDYYDGEDAYSDGDIEDRLLEIVQTTKKSDYQKVILSEQSWPVFYHLSPQRENILDWYEFSDNASVLEVGAGCGAISGVLCRRAGRVVANDLSRRRSTINAYRNQDAENLEIIVGNFNLVSEKLEERFDYVTLIGVLEYAKSYMGKENPYPEYLEKINNLLKPGGKILIAIENRLGMKYFAGCKEDHVGREFAGIEGYSGIDFVETFSKPELEKLLEENGFKNYKFYYPYPDYKFPTVIYSDEYLPKPGELRRNQQNFDADRVLLFDEGKAFDTILRSGLFPIFSNSFLIEVEKKESADL